MRRGALSLSALTAALVASSACRFGYESLDLSRASGGQFANGNGGATLATGGRSPFGGSAGATASAGTESGGSPEESGGAGGAATATGGTTSLSGGMLGRGGALGSGGASAGNASGGTSSGGTSSGGISSSGGAGGAGTGGNAGQGGGAVTGIVVTTQADEADSGATPMNPGQSGFSLREAIAYANRELGRQSITFGNGVTIIRIGSPLPAIQETSSITGPIAVDASPNTSTGACLSVTASDVLIDTVEVHHCRGEPVLFSAAQSSGNQIARSFLHENQKALVARGDGVVVLYNYVSSSGGPGIEIYSTKAQVLANEVVGSVGANILVHDGADAALLLANLSIGGNVGVALGAVTGATLWHNTLASPVSSALDVGAASAVDARNNIFFGAGGYGISGSAAQFSNLDYDLFFNDAMGNCRACTPGSASIFADPAFTDPNTLDYSLKPGSPAIDKGTNVGSDRNLEKPGLFNGNAPDIGFIEAP